MSTTVLRSFSPQKSPPKFLLPSQPSSARGAVGSRPCSPDCILGYTGSRFKNFDEDDNKKTTILPIIGYTGDYRGKVEGKFGRAETHKFPISVLDESDDYPEIAEDGSNAPFSPLGIRTDDSVLGSSNSINTPSPTKKFIVGYTGASVKAEPKVETPKTKIPIIGYSGDFKGKVNGKLGRPERHTLPLSYFDKETTYDVIGENKFHQRQSVKRILNKK